MDRPQLHLNREIHIKNDNTRRILDVMILVLALGALFLLGFFVGGQYSANIIDISRLSSVVNTTGSLPERTITISSPTQDQQVNGMISVEGEAGQNVDTVLVEVYDSNDNLLARDTFEDVTGTFRQSIVIEGYTTSDKGYIRVSSPTNPTDNAKVSIEFETQKVARRVIVSTPMENQLITEEVLFKGEMSGFFEGTMNVRIKDATGKVLFNDFVTASGDNLETFAEFNKVLEITNLANVGSQTGTFEIYEESAKDGSENIVLSFVVRLK